MCCTWEDSLTHPSLSGSGVIPHHSQTHMKNHRQCSAHLHILFLLATEVPTPVGCNSLTPYSSTINWPWCKGWNTGKRWTMNNFYLTYSEHWAPLIQYSTVQYSTGIRLQHGSSSSEYFFSLQSYILCFLPHSALQKAISTLLFLHVSFTLICWFYSG